MNSQDHPTPADTAAELERQIREAGVSDADVAAAATALEGRVAWSAPPEGEARRLMVLAGGVANTVADALTALKPATAPKSADELRQERTDAYMRDRDAAKIDPPLPDPSIPDHKLTSEQYMIRRKAERLAGKR
jgi:hypothetical protein